MNAFTIFLIFCNILGAANFLPSTEYNALEDLYDLTGGDHWSWFTPFSYYGYPWNFTTIIQQNPCNSSHLWQGIQCTTDCSVSECHVQNLTLSNRNLRGQIPPTIEYLQSLVRMDFAFNKLTGSIPVGVGSLIYLQFIDIHTNSLSKNIPSELGNLLQLRQLKLSFNAFTGSIPISFGNLVKLYDLELSNNQLIGSIPPSFGNLIQLRTLALESNFLSKHIPEELGNLVHLEILFLCNNTLSGTIPATLGNFINLQYLYLNENQLSKSIPASFGNLTQLQYLMAYSNELTGSIPDGLGHLHDLLLLSLYSNHLTGTIPSTLGELEALQLLYLYSNHLNGTVPESFGNLQQLLRMYLRSNALTGTIPATFSQLKELQYLDLSSNLFTGTVPSITSSCSLAVLNLRHNYFHGTFPTNYLCNCTSIQQIDITDNLLSGAIPSVPVLSKSYCFDNLIILQLSNNRLQGTLPTDFLKNRLRVLYLNQNSFSGSIPDTWFDQATSLNQLCLAQNCLSGTIPSSICTSKNLQQVSLDGLHSTDSCVSKIIPWYSQSALFADKLVGGSIPSCMFQFPNITQLQLSGNALTGTIPSNVTNTLTTVILANNQLKGTIPSVFWHSDILKYLDLSFNRFEDTFPEAPFPALHASQQEDNSNVTLSYYLQNNRLSGTIPSNLQSAEKVNFLEANQFSCKVDRSDLPEHDPQRKSYDCGSDATNFSVIAWTVTAGVCGIAVFVCYCLFSFYNDRIQHMRIFVHIHNLCLQMHEWWLSYKTFVVEGKYETESTFAHLKVMHRLLILSWKLCLLVMIIGVMIFLPVYGCLNAFYHTYRVPYIWVLSACYLSGLTPAVILCALYIISLSFIGSISIARSVNLLGSFDDDSNKNNMSRQNVAVDNEMNQSKAKDIEDEINSTKGTPVTSKKFWSDWWYVKFQYTMFLLFNTIMVCGVNMAYVYVVVVGNYDITIITISSLLLSVFKLIWNNLVLGGSLYRLVVEKIFVDVRLQGLHFLFLSLFNNIFIPYLAQALVSPTCFLYVIQLPPVITIYILQFKCSLTNFIINGVNNPVLTSCARNSYDTTSYYPAFTYTYQCSSSLVSAFAHVFVYRFLISAIICPLLFMGMKYVAMKSSITMKTWLLKCLPPMWRLDISSTFNGKEYQQYKDFEHSILQSSFGNLLAIEIVTSFAMMLTFGIAFPLLMVIIACSVISHILIYCLHLGQWIQQMQRLSEDDSSQDPSIVVLISYRAEVSKSLMQLLINVDQEKLNEVKKIFLYGIILSIGIAAVFLSFFLFDILADDVGPAKGYWIVLVMCLTSISVLVVVLLLNRSAWSQQQPVDDPIRSTQEKLAEVVANNPILAQRTCENERVPLK